MDGFPASLGAAEAPNGTSTEAIRDRNHDQVGAVLIREAEAIVQIWTERALAEGHGRPSAHQIELRDHLPSYLRALGDALTTEDAGIPSDPRTQASEHGRIRWQSGWNLNEVIGDYQLLRIVVLEKLRDLLERDLKHDEILALGVHFDDAVTAAVVAFVEHQAGQLRLAHRRLNEFLGVLGHELRNPLGTIAVALQVAKMLKPPDPDLGEAIEAIGRGANTMTRLMDDMLDVARITRGELEIRPEPVVLSEVIAAAIEGSQPIMTERRHQLSVSIDPKPMPLSADATRLQQVVVNLLTNAAKYTEPGGSIRLSASREGNEALIQVQDNGVGIDPEFLPHVFELFSQASEHHDRGLGIGLALVRSLVERHGGTIAVESEGRGRGSTFTVRLPLSSPPLNAERREESHRIESAVLPAASHGARRILVVDDEQDAARLLASLLEQNGHDVIVAFDGASALALASTLSPDLVLLDLGLPDLDGGEVAVMLRQICSSSIRVVALTGYVAGQRRGDDEDGMDARFDLFLTKPVSHDALARAFALFGPSDS